MYIRIHVKYRLFLSNFSENKFSTQIQETNLKDKIICRHAKRTAACLDQHCSQQYELNRKDFSEKKLYSQSVCFSLSKLLSKRFLNPLTIQRAIKMYIRLHVK